MYLEDRDEIRRSAFTLIGRHQGVGGRIVGHFVDAVRATGIDSLDLARVQIDDLQRAVTIAPSDFTRADHGHTIRPSAARWARADETPLASGLQECVAVGVERVNGGGRAVADYKQAVRGIDPTDID